MLEILLSLGNTNLINNFTLMSANNLLKYINLCPLQGNSIAIPIFCTDALDIKLASGNSAP